MSEPFLAEIKIVGFNFPPRGWAQCDGQILLINTNQSLYSLLGTTYGGDGRTTFALPDLRGRTPIHVGGGHSLGERSGEETHTLSVAETPNHDHALLASSTDGNTALAPGNILAREVGAIYDSSTANQLTADSTWVTNTGGGQGHENMQPFLTLNFVIALQGLFPSRS